MDGRTIATHGGGDLVIGGGPPVDGVLHAWYYPEGARGAKGGYGIMLGHTQAEALKEALGHRQGVIVRTFAGSMKLTFTRGLACMWLYRFAQGTPDRVVRLYEGAIEAAVDAIGEALNPMVSMPVDLHDASLTAPAREQLEQLLAAGLIRRAA